MQFASSLHRGIACTIAWAIWLAGGALYVQAHGSIRTFVSDIPQSAKPFVAIWIVVSATLLFGAIIFTARGFFKPASTPGSGNRTESKLEILGWYILIGVIGSIILTVKTMRQNHIHSVSDAIVLGKWWLIVFWVVLALALVTGNDKGK